MNLAILSPNKNAYSETFIQAHKKLPFNVFFYYDGFLPTQLEGKAFNRNPLRRVFFKITSLVNNRLSYDELRLRQSFKEHKIDCVLAEFGITAAESLRVVKSLSLPLITHFHGADASQHDILKKYKIQYLEVFKYSRYVIAVSKKMYQGLLDMGCDSDKLLLNTCGPAEAFLNTSPTFSLGQFVGVGRFVDKKAPYLTILAFASVHKQFPEAKLIFAGDGPLLNTCKNLAEVLHLEKKVLFLGKVTPGEILLLYQQSIAFVQHSIVADNGDSEGTPVAVVEASAAGLPVISTFHAGIPDVILNGQTGLLVNEMDVEGMSRAMIQLLEKPAQAKEMGRAGAEYIKANFSMQQHLRILTDAMKRAVQD